MSTKLFLDAKNILGQNNPFATGAMGAHFGLTQVNAVSADLTANGPRNEPTPSLQ